MTIFYASSTVRRMPTKDQMETWEHLSQKRNWRIVKLPNGYFQTEFKSLHNENYFSAMTRRATVEEAEKAIDETIMHFKEKIAEFTPEVVKTFE